MPLPTPELDGRRYRDLVEEALARIPVHNPEWTNFNDADPGVTLLQLFAFMAENVIYRANLIPERNRQKYLRLLGMPLRAAQAARGLVAFESPRTGLVETVTLQEDLEVLAGSVPFRTENGLDVLPVEARVYLKSPLQGTRRAEAERLYRRLYASHETAGQTLDFYETLPFTTPASGMSLPVIDLADTLDGALWIALLARPRADLEETRRALAGRILSLGVLPALEVDGLVLGPGGSTSGAGGVLAVPGVLAVLGGGGSSGSGPSLVFEIPNAGSRQPRYERLDARVDADLLTHPGIAELSLPDASKLRTWLDLDPLEPGVGDYPPSLEDSSDQERLVTWIRVRSPQADPRGTGAGGGGSRQVTARLSWLGINAAHVVQRARVRGELLPAGTGDPDQTLTLARRPVIPGSVRLTVNGEVWQEVDDLAAAPPETAAGPAGSIGSGPAPGAPASPKVYTVDRESGEVRFGDGIRGMRPPRGAVLQASYDFGGGRAGLAGIGAINKLSGSAFAGKVTNPVPTWGGDESESVEEGERRIPAFLRHRDRLVSAEDFAEITRGTPGVDLGRVEVLPLFHPDLPEAPAQGVVTVLVIPVNDTEQPEAPRPDLLFLETVCRHLEPRRLVTTELHVRGPVYRPVWVSIGLDVVPGRDQGPVREAVRAAIRRFLSPLSGGFEGRGWPLGKSVEAAEVSAAATRVDGVAKVNGLLLGGAAGGAVSTLPLVGLELPQLMGLAVESGDPAPLELVRGEAPEPQPAGPPVVPVPIVPEEC